MSGSKSATPDDVVKLIIFIWLLTMVMGGFDSCHDSWRYRDLRDRLERIEQRQQ